MMKNSTEEKRCFCGRIIIESNNKTVLCPKCQKKVANGAAVVGTVGVIAVIKKIGPKVANGVMRVVKR